MDIQSTHRSRRSFPNLQHLSLAPLSSRFPIDGDDFSDDPDVIDNRIRVSYIQGKSAPTTPSILSDSRNSSRARSKSKTAKRRSAHGHEHYFSPDLEISDMQVPTKAKSAVGLVDTASAAAAAKHHVRRVTGEPMLHPIYSRHIPRRSQGSDDEWLHRAGMIMSAEARENKGQSWLVSRDSSTSLIGYSMSGEHLNEDEHGGFVSPHFSRAHSRIASRAVSRVGSRAPSAKTSRRGSMVGTNRLGFMTPLDAKTSGVVGTTEGYFDDLEDIAEPDFVDAEDDGIVDDEEVSRLANQKGFGLGGLVDRLVGFSLFNVDEDVEETDDDGAEISNEEAIKRRQAELKKRREELAQAAKNSADATRRAEHVQPANRRDEGSWQDAAWLVSVASKVLY